MFSKNTPNQINLRRSKRLQNSEQHSTNRAFISTNQQHEAELLAFFSKSENKHLSLSYNTNLARQNDLQGDLLSEITPFTYIAKGDNPNILAHRDAMKADDNEQFLILMKQEVDKLLENEIYEIVPRNTVPKTKTVLNDVWSHRRKTTPDGQVYRHRS